MADDEKEEKKEEEKKEKGGDSSKKNLIKIIIIAVAALVLIVGIGLGAYMLGAKSAPTGLETDPAAEAVEVIKPVPVINKNIDELGPLVPIDEFLINLLDRDTSRYLKATITLEVDSEKTAEEVQTRMPQIRDAILLLTSNKTYGELQDMQGKMQLRAELIGHLNTLLGKGLVRHIYITNFVIQ